MIALIADSDKSEIICSGRNLWWLSPHGWVRRLKGVEKDLYSYQITFNRYWKIHLIAKTAGLEGYLSVDVRTNDPHLKNGSLEGKLWGGKEIYKAGWSTREL